MFWDKIAGLYDLFENIYNKQVFQGTGKHVAALIGSTDKVLECACGTGAISKWIAPVCSELIATDYSTGMLEQARKNLSSFKNVSFAQTDITALPYDDNSFDCVVAGNVIHLLPDPAKAVSELLRVCRPGGKLIIPTYINNEKSTNQLAVKFLELLGANFKRQFDETSYKKFFADLGFENVEYDIVRGRMACDIAIIRDDIGFKRGTA